MDSLNIKWSQEDDLVFLHIKDDKFFFQAPPGYNIHEVDESLKELALFHLLFNCGYFSKKGNTELPSHIHENITKPITGKNIALSYSNGCDSAATLLCLPPEKTIPIYLKRDFSKVSSKKIIGKCTVFNRRLKNKLPQAAVDFNYNALRLMEKANIPNLKIINNDFELIRPYLLPNLREGFILGIGYAAIIILLSKFLDIGYITFGAISESVFLGTGHRFIDVISKHRSSEAKHFQKIYKAYGLGFSYVLGGCSEVVTSYIVRNSKYKDTACSCQNKISADQNFCNYCVKCFRNFGMNGQMIPKIYYQTWGAKLYKFPLKMATSTLYACQKINYTNEFIEQYMHLDMSYLERYYGPYLEKEDDNQIALVPDEFREYIKNNISSKNCL